MSRDPHVIESGKSLKDARAKLAAGKVSTLAVLDDEYRIVGLFGDYESRRAALADLDESVPVDEAMNKAVDALHHGTDDPDLLDAFSARRVRALPLEEGGAYHSILEADDVPGFEETMPVAVVMAGGRGQRLRPLTDKVPKPLLKVGTSTILERIIGALRDAGVAQVYLSVNYKAKVFEERLGTGEDLGVAIDYLREHKKLGTAGSLGMLPEEPTGPILVTNADILTRLDFSKLFDFHRRHGDPVTVAAVHHTERIPYGVMRADGDRLVGLEEKPEVRVLCNAGIYVLDPEVLRYVAPDEVLDMPDLISRLLDDNVPVHVFPIVERWFDIGSPEDFQRVLIEFAMGEED